MRYTTACAQDYLDRVAARAGTWLVSVYRLLGGERRHLVTVRMKREKLGDSPVGKSSPRTTMQV
ncbi:hypothetical protein [Amycolatopsis anabasis]|uniref:hypothetical protein n=1 Tax=Amycolatopsis anabasis TaxID=1840409 RepID=UPI0015D2636B|nr:hypothetical protein [Amycolatopsis anabasis]